VLSLIDEAAFDGARDIVQSARMKFSMQMHANLTYCVDLRVSMSCGAVRLRRYGYRRHAESFDRIFWDEANRLANFEKRPIDFAIANRSNWSSILKRLDIEHPDWPPRFNALVALEIATPPPVFFVVYCKEDRDLKIISLRLANAEERSICAR
jgi:uncharacterized DUF497 family protein